MDMRCCPQCHNTFSEDYVFCLNDGTLLVDESGEQETLVNRRFEFHPTTSSLPPDLLVACGECGLANRAGARFCKKCGGGLGAAMPDSVGGYASARSNMDGSFEETVAFQLGAFTPPQTVTAAKPPGNKRVLYVMAGIGSILLLGVFLFLVQGGATKDSGSNQNAPNNSNANRLIETELPKTFEREYAGSVAGYSLTMSLLRDGSKLSGSASTDRKSDTLEGNIENDGAFRLNAYENGVRYTGIWRGRIDGSGSVTGEWSKPDGSASRSFEMQQR